MLILNPIRNMWAEPRQPGCPVAAAAVVAALLAGMFLIGISIRVHSQA